jgi:hypothetical protein
MVESRRRRHRLLIVVGVLIFLAVARHRRHIKAIQPSTSYFARRDVEYYRKKIMSGGLVWGLYVLVATVPRRLIRRRPCVARLIFRWLFPQTMLGETRFFVSGIVCCSLGVIIGFFVSYTD